MELIIEKLKRNKNEKVSEINASSVWRCCKCREEMYRGESSCNYCKHSRCSSCKRLEV